MTQLHQIQVQYVAVEDRALLRIATRDRAEFRFWVTRRYASLMLPALVKSLETSPLARSQSQPTQRSAVLAFEREAALGTADFETEYRAQNEEMPLGEEPVLLARLGVRRDPDGTIALAMHPHTGQGIEIRLNDSLVHSLIKLLEDAARSGSWALPGALPASAAAATPQRPN